jgi:hypothetical protein
VSWKKVHRICFRHRHYQYHTHVWGTHRGRDHLKGPESPENININIYSWTHQELKTLLIVNNPTNLKERFEDVAEKHGEVRHLFVFCIHTAMTNKENIIQSKQAWKILFNYSKMTDSKFQRNSTKSMVTHTITHVRFSYKSLGTCNIHFTLGEPILFVTNHRASFDTSSLDRPYTDARYSAWNNFLKSIRKVGNTIRWSFLVETTSNVWQELNGKIITRTSLRFRWVSICTMVILINKHTNWYFESSRSPMTCLTSSAKYRPPIKLSVYHS